MWTMTKTPRKSVYELSQPRGRLDEDVSRCNVATRVALLTAIPLRGHRRNTGMQ